MVFAQAHALAMAGTRSPPAMIGGPMLELTHRLSVLRGFELCLGGALLVVPVNVARVLAFLAVRGRPQLRSTVASTLWIDTTDDRAAANLRTALWKIRSLSGDWLLSSGGYVSLAPMVDVDLSMVVAQARRLVSREEELDPADTDADALLGDLLPGWDEEWIIFERERLRQLRMHALEALCQRLAACGRTCEAIDAGLAAVAAEPLRESAQRALIAAHLAEGNLCEARRQYHLYREVLNEYLDEDPSDSLAALVGLRRIDSPA